MTWLPGLIVLAIGLGVGLLAGRRLRGAKKPSDARDLELQIADLETRRDDLYRRLREIDEGVGQAADRPALEKAAARTLLELDRLAEEHPKAVRRRPEESKAESRARAAAPAPSTARIFLVGFSYGVGLILLVGALVYWAVRDAKPSAESQAGPMSSPAPSQAPVDPHQEGNLPPEVADRIVSLDSYIMSNPEDLQARKELAYVLLGVGRYVDAFGQADQILQRNSRDPDGLYIQGVVRLTMGQADQAQVLLLAAVTSDPTHVDALTALGVIEIRQGQREEAIAHWKGALSALGGSQPTLERMIAAAEAGGTPEEVLGMPTPATAAPAAAPPSPEPGAPAPTPADGFTVSLDLQPGAIAPSGAILFVSLSGAGGGPPAAVRRISAPSFPMTLSLTQADSMMGAQLPESGTINARLDADGSASTRSPEDLAASAEARMGEAISLRLASGN